MPGTQPTVTVGNQYYLKVILPRIIIIISIDGKNRLVMGSGKMTDNRQTEDF